LLDMGMPSSVWEELKFMFNRLLKTGFYRWGVMKSNSGLIKMRPMLLGLQYGGPQGLIGNKIYSELKLYNTFSLGNIILEISWISPLENTFPPIICTVSVCTYIDLLIFWSYLSIPMF